MKMPPRMGAFSYRVCGAMHMSLPSALSRPVNGVNYRKESPMLSPA